MYELKKLDHAQIEISFTIQPAEYAPDLDKAALRLSERAAIKGFRPGKAPYDIVKQQVGEAKILEDALETIVQRTYFVAVKAEKLETIGMPNVKIGKLAPGNELTFTATVALMPSFTLPPLTKIKVTRQKKEVGEKDVADVLENLRKMQPKEVAKEGAATKEDKIIIKMEMFIDKVPVEGGLADNHQVYLSEPHYIPGLAEQLVGLKKKENKEFTLKFPKDHYQKHLAGKNVDFKINVKELFALEYAELNDDFAKAVGQESMTKLKELLLQNIDREAEQKEEQRLEAEIIEEMIKATKFGDLPQILIDSEKRKMFYELKNDLDRRGLTVENYLNDIKKTEKEIFEDFAENATKRAQAALISRQFAKDNNISVSKDDIDAEIAIIKKTYQGDAKVEENLKRPEVIDTIAATIQNRKVVQLLKEKIITKE